MTQLANLTKKTDWKQHVYLEYKKTKQRKEMMKMTQETSWNQSMSEALDYVYETYGAVELVDGTVINVRSD
jgi:hypothetical protein